MDFALLKKLLPHEMRQYVIQTLDVRLPGKNTKIDFNKTNFEKQDDQIIRLSDHRPLFLKRNIIAPNENRN